jgi:peptide/nickel transport system substrate-binding protein
MFVRSLALALALLFAGGAAPPPARLVVAQTVEPASLDPLTLTGTPAEEIGSLVYSYLVRIDERGRLVPDLAERVPSIANGDLARDGRTIVYHLRGDVRWQDGVRFTARDVVATYRAIMDARNPVPTRLGFDRVRSLDALDDRTLRVRLREPFAPFLTYFFETENYPVLPAHVLARTASLAGSSLATAPVGTGPYVVSGWQRGDALRLRANPNYFGGAPKIARLTLRFVASTQTIAELLQTGEADATFGADPALIDRLRANPRLRLATVPLYGFEALAMQTADPQLRDPRVRRALAHVFAFERDLQRASHGALTTRDAGRALFTFAYAPQAVATADAGYLPLHLTLAIDASRALERAMAVQLQDDARRAGLQLDIVPYAPQVFLAPAADRGPIESGRYQLALLPLLTGADPETTWLLGCDQVPPAGYDVTRYCNSTVDAALRDGLASVDEARRIRDYRIVQRAIARDVPFVMLWQLREIEALPAGLRGFSGSPETPWYHVERWSR